MGTELKNLKLNVTQIALLSGAHRQTVNNRLKNISPSGGNGSNLTLYSLTDILAEFVRPPAPVNHEDMNPQDRKAWFQSERERLKFQLETSQLIPAEDCQREYAFLCKGMLMMLETLPDILERDCGLTPQATSYVQKVIDDFRDRVAAELASDKFYEEGKSINDDEN
ncbi:DUF1441 family protein [Buttiauxella gaviniae]|uniref:DUF1441 family protein n=1 Tax=Buttiauxella gaviniae TaxID=82990 RepID=UPI00397518B9